MDAPGFPQLYNPVGSLGVSARLVGKCRAFEQARAPEVIPCPKGARRAPHLIFTAFRTAQTMAAALSSPAPTAPTDGAADAAVAPSPDAIAHAPDEVIIQSTPIGPNLSLQSLKDVMYRMVSENSFQTIDLVYR